MEHTPLPWEIDTGNTIGHIKSISTKNKKMPDGSFSTPTIARYDIGVNLGYRLRPEKEQQANADLIIKAVNCHYELVEACKELIELIREYHKDIGGCDHDVGICLCGEYAILNNAQEIIDIITGK